jgi:lambda family phage portal protein
MKFPWISKRASVKRIEIARGSRGFAAAETDRLLSGWRFDIGFTPSEISSHLNTVRGRSRQMAKDSPHYRRWLQLIATNVVGQGFALKSTPHDGKPGALALDEQAAKIIEYHWWRFCTYRDPDTHGTWFDATGRKTDSDMDRLNAKTWARDGEFFIHVLRTPSNPYGITFRVMRPDWCDETHNNSDTGNGTLIHCGVEMQISTRKPVAYWFRTVPQNAYAYNGSGQPLMRIPASEIIHVFSQDDEDQPRGIPWSHASLRKLKMIEMLDEAELTAARDEACTTHSYYAPKGGEEAVADLTSDENSDVAKALTMEKEPGQAEVLPVGWRKELHTPQHPNGQHGIFKSGMLKDVASGFGVEYSNFANDWAGVSFSSVRVGTISERDCWIVLQDEMISRCKSIQFLLWLKSFLSMPIGSDLPAAKYDKFREHEWRGRRWMWVDPMKDMNAAEKAVAHGWKTNSQVASDMGTDYGDNIEELKREQLTLAGDDKDSVPSLNGAQITAALEVVQNYAAGLIGKDASIALLTAAGVPQEAANNMINKQKVEKAVVS